MVSLIWILDLLIKINKCICSILHRIGLVDCLDAVRHSAELRNYVKLEEQSSIKVVFNFIYCDAQLLC